MARMNPLDGDANDHNDHDDDDDAEDGAQLAGDDGDDGDGDDLGDDGDDGAEDGEPIDGDDDDDAEDGEPLEREQNPDEAGAAGLGAYLRQLRLGSPFAISGGFEITEAKIIVRHEDGPHAGKLFRVDLLNGKIKRSPYDGAELTHALILAPPDDPEIVCDVVTHILEANGQQTP